jgi:uncharacterized protein (DUF433 family)
MSGRQRSTSTRACPFGATSPVYPRLAVDTRDSSARVSRGRWSEVTGGRAVFDRITFDPRIMGGRACIRGIRIPVSVIVGQVAHGATFEEILQGYPDLEREDIQEALEYAAWLTRDEVRSP